MSITKSSIFTDPWLPFQLANVLNDNGNQSQNFFGQIAHFVFFQGGCYVIQSQNLYYQKNTLHNYLSLMYFIAHTSHMCYAVEYLTSQAMMSQSVLNLYQYVLLKPGKIYHLHTASICC